MSDVEQYNRGFHAAAAAYEAVMYLEKDAEKAAIRVLAAHVLSVVPEATHMLLESSDQGQFMNPPTFLTDATGQHVAEEAWDAYYEEHQDEMWPPAEWLTWGHESWERWVDEDHPYTRRPNGYYAIDLRRLGARMKEEETHAYRGA